jgi:DNA-binding beta-propeller fold protein YncE
MEVPMHPVLRSVVGLVSAHLAACGGGGGAPSSPGGPPPPPPAVSVTFPHVGGFTDADSIVVRGTASSSIALQGVEVGGVAATSADGFSTWQAVVPLALGENLLAAQATDALGGQNATSTVTVRRELGIPTSPMAVAVDPVSSAVYVADYAAEVIWRIDEAPGGGAPGSIARVSGGGVGSGPALHSPVTLALDPVGKRLFVAQNALEDVVAVDLATGDRSVVSSASVGSGPSAGFAPALAYDASSDTLYAAAVSTAAVVAIAVSTGQRTLLSGGGAGSGPAFATVVSLAHDPVANRLVVGSTGGGETALVGVDPATGARTVLTGAGVGSGPVLFGAFDVAVDASAGVCYSTQNAYPGQLVATDLATGVRGAVALLAPSPLLAATGVALDEPGGRLIVADAQSAGVAGVDLATGEVTWIWLPARGGGPVLEAVVDVALLPGGQTAVALDDQQDGRLTFVDLATGARSLSPSAGATTFGVRAMAWDEAGARALAAAFLVGGQGLLAIDGATGVRTILSGPTVGSGPALVSPAAVAFDAAGQTAWVSDDAVKAVFAIDLATGARTIVSDGVTGQGPLPSTWRGLAFEPVTGRVLLGGVVGAANGVVGIDPADGDRTLLSGLGQGSGQLAFFARSLVPTPDGLGLWLDGSSSVLAIDLLTGDRATVSGLEEPVTVGLGPALTYLADELCGAGPAGVLLVHDDETNALLLVDTVTGERVIVSR